ncbi:carbon starvation induced protein CsiD, partial [Vibrio fortis]
MSSENLSSVAFANVTTCRREFSELTQDYNLQSLEYKAFLRFAVADALDKA